LELHEDNQTTFSSCSSKFDNQYQVLAIVGDNSEEFNDNNNPVLNPANINRGENHLAEGDTVESMENRVKVRLSAEEWNTIKPAVEHGTAILTDALQKQSKQLEKERSEIRKRMDSAIAPSVALHAERSNASYTNSKRHHRHGSRFENLEHSDRRNISRNLDSSFLLVDEQGNIIPKTPKAALVAAQTYLYTTRLSLGDPREHMHRGLDTPYHHSKGSS
jgi:predicted transcriptional regulator